MSSVLCCKPWWSSGKRVGSNSADGFESPIRQKWKVIVFNSHFPPPGHIGQIEKDGEPSPVWWCMTDNQLCFLQIVQSGRTRFWVVLVLVHTHTTRTVWSTCVCVWCDLLETMFVNPWSRQLINQSNRHRGWWCRQKNRRCYPLCFISRRPIKKTSVTPYVFFSRRLIKNDGVVLFHCDR